MLTIFEELDTQNHYIIVMEKHFVHARLIIHEIRLYAIIFPIRNTQLIEADFLMFMFDGIFFLCQ